MFRKWWYDRLNPSPDDDPPDWTTALAVALVIVIIALIAVSK